MYLSPRHSEIIQMAKDHGRVLVEDLATHFNVTPQTIRKDLNDLCDQRLLSHSRRALFPSGIENMEYEARRKIAAEERGDRPRQTDPDNASLFINISTTTESVSKALLDHAGPDGHHQ
jgi:DeoR family glycerol-3-phosphate regulon repressor